MEIERTVSSETSAIRTQMPENYPKRNTLHLEHGESLKTIILKICLRCGVDENCVLLGNDPPSNGNFLPTFRDNLTVTSSGVKNA